MSTRVQCSRSSPFPSTEESVRTPLSLFRGKAMNSPGPNGGPVIPLLGSTPPEPSRRSRAWGMGGGVRGCPLLWDHSPKVSRTQQRPSTHRALMARGRWESQVPLDRRSRLHPPPRGSDPHTTSRAVRPLPPNRSGRFSPQPLAGGGRETRTHQWCRTTHPLYPMGTRGGDSSVPIRAVQVRCPMPEAWLPPIGHP